MHRPRGIIFFTSASLVMAAIHIIVMTPGVVEDYPPLPGEWLVALAHILPASLGLLMALGLWFWNRGVGGKSLAAGAITALIIYQVFFFAMLLPLVAWGAAIYLLIQNVRAKLKLRRAPAETPPAPSTSTPKRWTSRILQPSFLKGLLLFAIVLGVSFLPCANPAVAAATPPAPFSNPDAGLNFTARQALFRQRYSAYDPTLSAVMGLTVNEQRLLRNLERIRSVKDSQDFDMLRLLRFLYLENSTSPPGKISDETRTQIHATLLGAKYWFTDPGPNDAAIYWTENHQIAYHSSELLAGQLWKASTFSRSQMTGAEHIARAERRIAQWIEWRARFGFAEWHSNTYYAVDISSLLAIVDFAENATLATKAAMVVDLILFEWANNWYKGKIATTLGRSYGEDRIGTGINNLPEETGVGEVAWILLGLGRDLGQHGTVEVASVTTKYVPPPLLEKIAQDAAPNHEHRARSNVQLADGPALGIPYDEDHLMFYWGMAAPVSAWTIDLSFATIQKYQINPGIVCGTGIPEMLHGMSALRGVNLSTYAGMVKEITQGVTLETANTYTYRTPYYQLSGAQDRQKGLAAFQVLTWQASLTDYAYVLTNAPGGVSFKGGEFMGGWQPRATFSKNVGVIQYDHAHQTLEGAAIVYLLDCATNLLQGDRPYNHAYFPTWAFSTVVQRGHWTFGEADGGYLALYSANPTFWANSYELQSWGAKNCWIVEMGSVAESGSFSEFAEAISAAPVSAWPLVQGYAVRYESPSRGLVEVAWEGSMTVAGSAVDLGPYARFENAYAHTTFGSLRTVIEFNHERLTLDFEVSTRTVTVE